MKLREWSFLAWILASFLLVACKGEEDRWYEPKGTRSYMLDTSKLSGARTQFAHFSVRVPLLPGKASDSVTNRLQAGYNMITGKQPIIMKAVYFARSPDNRYSFTVTKLDVTDTTQPYYSAPRIIRNLVEGADTDTTLRVNTFMLSGRPVTKMTFKRGRVLASKYIFFQPGSKYSGYMIDYWAPRVEEAQTTPIHESFMADIQFN